MIKCLKLSQRPVSSRFSRETKALKGSTKRGPRLNGADGYMTHPIKRIWRSFSRQWHTVSVPYRSRINGERFALEKDLHRPRIDKDTPAFQWKRGKRPATLWKKRVRPLSRFFEFFVFFPRIQIATAKAAYRSTMPGKGNYHLSAKLFSTCQITLISEIKL